MLRAAIWSTTDLGHFLPGIMLIDFLHDSFFFSSSPNIYFFSSSSAWYGQMFVVTATTIARECTKRMPNEWMDATSRQIQCTYMMSQRPTASQHFKCFLCTLLNFDRFIGREIVFVFVCLSTVHRHRVSCSVLVSTLAYQII